MNFKVLLCAQFLIALMMSFLMTGIFNFIQLGFSYSSFLAWLKKFGTAFPIAFILSMIVSKFAFFIANKIVGTKELEIGRVAK